MQKKRCYEVDAGGRTTEEAVFGLNSRLPSFLMKCAVQALRSQAQRTPAPFESRLRRASRQHEGSGLMTLIKGAGLDSVDKKILAIEEKLGMNDVGKARQSV